MSDKLNAKISAARGLHTCFAYLEAGTDPDYVGREIAPGGEFVLHQILSILSQGPGKNERIAIVTALGSMIAREFITRETEISRALEGIVGEMQSDDMDVRGAAVKAMENASSAMLERIAGKAPNDVLSEGTVEPPRKLKRFLSKLRKRGRVKGRGESDNMPSPLKRKR